MDPLTAGALIGGGTALLGGIMGNQGSASQSASQMAFQREMSNTAHAREVADLRSAGLNPMLSALGSGASTPQGSQATVNDLAPGISKGVETAIGLKNAEKDIDLKTQQTHSVQEDVGLKTYQKGKTQEEMAQLRKSRPQVDAANKSAQEEVKAKRLSNKLMETTLPSLIKQAKATGDWAQVNQFLNAAKTGASTASDIKDTINPISVKIKGK